MSKTGEILMAFILAVLVGFLVLDGGEVLKKIYKNISVTRQEVTAPEKSPAPKKNTAPVKEI